MSKIYLQEKISGQPGYYIITDEDGFLTSGELPTAVYPQINIVAPAGSTNFSGKCNGVNKPIEVTQTSETTWICIVKEFGSWEISAVYQNDIMSDEINISEVSLYSMVLTNIKPLAKASWQEIKQYIDEGIASTVYSIGDQKVITLNGSVGSKTFTNNQYYCFIIGIDHNAAIEGSGITFQIGKDSLGNPLSFIDSYYATNPSSSTNCFKITNSARTGWKDTFMRTTIMNQFYNCFSNDLKAVCSYKTIFSVNSQSSYSSISETDVSKTNENVYLLSAPEITGTTDSTTVYEFYYQKQYDYYKTNSAIKVNDTRKQICEYWTRSFGSGSNYYRINTSGSYTTGSAAYSYGISPVFYIGNNVPTTTTLRITRSGNSRVRPVDVVGSYITVDNDSTKYTSGAVDCSIGSQINIYARSAYDSSSDSYTNVRVRLNGTYVGNTSSSSSIFSNIYSFIVQPGAIQIALVSGNSTIIDIITE